jgi:YegS/Rv2252/BmrU family lipid kinase
MTAPLTLVINPAAGSGLPARYLPRVTAVLDASGRRYTTCESMSLEHARSLATEAAGRGDAVVAVGGDGLTGALAGTAAAGLLGIIPAGKGNDFARALRIPFEPGAAARVLADGRTRAVDLIAVTSGGPGGHGPRPPGPAGPGAGETLAAPVTAVGSVYIGIASVAAEIANRSRFVRGRLLYNLAALRALAGWKPTRFRVDAVTPDAGQITHEFCGYAVVAANSPYFGAGMRVAPDARIGDGLLDVVIMRDAPKLTFLRGLAKLKDGSHVTLAEVSTLRATAVSVTVDRPLPAGADGEILTPGPPWHIRALPAALSVIAPGQPRAERAP